jgi:hypothetical protein
MEGGEGVTDITLQDLIVTVVLILIISLVAIFIT